jgi:hypothetical protein
VNSNLRIGRILGDAVQQMKRSIIMKRCNNEDRKYGGNTLVKKIKSITSPSLFTCTVVQNFRA